MRLLVLGGTAFLGRAVAARAHAEGHEVTCAARGESGSPPPGVRFVTVDRDRPDGLAPLGDHEYDAVVDVGRRPSHVRRALAALADRAGHWTFVSTCSVYADNGTPGQRAGSAPLVPAATAEMDDPGASLEAYGRCKVACEQAVVEAVGPDRAFLCRAGLIVGPEDPTGRFTYWVRRLARGGEVLAPGSAQDAVQWVDVRDLADWIVQAARTGLSGAYDGIGAPVGRGEFLAAVARGLGSDATLTWVDQEFLVANEVEPWSGKRSLPMWLPLPEYAGFMSRDVTASLAAGLLTRDVAQTARDTLTWVDGLDAAGELGAFGADSWPGLRAEEEAALITRFRGRTR